MSQKPVSKRLAVLASELDRELQRNILPFWAQTADRNKGGFAGLVSNDLEIDWNSPKGIVMHARHLWTYSQAWLYRKNETDLVAARHAYAFLSGPLHDGECGGFWWTVDAGQTPSTDVKVIYGQAFAIYGLAKFHRACGNRQSLDTALETFRLVESVARDRVGGGYFEAVDRRWTAPVDHALSDVDIPCSKSMNTNLHVLEAYSALYEATGLPVVREALESLLGVFETRILVTPEHLGLYFDREWKPLTDHVSFGHDVEASWLLSEAAALLYGTAVSEAKKAAYARIARTTLALVREHGGGLPNELHNGHLDTDRVWWVQAEALVGLVNGWELTGDEDFLAGSCEVWDYIQKHLIDRVRGEWFWAADAQGNPADKPKGGLWKTCYHNGRACMEINRRVS
jgi:mannobiose 2-epimerase